MDDLIANCRSFGGKKSDLVYEVSKRAILYRYFQPDVLLREQELAGQFACSQGTIREALMRLADDGLVERSGYRGTRVTRISLREAAEMVRIRLSIERAAAREIYRNGLDADRAALEEISQAMDASHLANDYLLSSELDRAFHGRIVRAAGMELLSPILQRCSLHIHRFTMGGDEVPREYFQEAGIGNEHRFLLDELTSGSAQRAEEALADHLAHVLGRWAPSLFEVVGREAFRVGVSA